MGRGHELPPLLCLARRPARAGCAGPCQCWKIRLAWAVSVKIRCWCPPPRFITQSPMPPEVVYTEVYRLVASARSDQATGHWRAISHGVEGPMAVTNGVPGAQVRGGQRSRSVGFPS
jgi:hypothetical protein